ncbi:MAG: hypothetical protein A3H91_00340 [Gammaproteobacteria bacterium RIFCSPLOWO2_02_FULL_61_13]|nr:MAG: hypothetical protein A3H91_00340 [Gammaproteobacteria bacterium RIFCSPLOWO2_02_FULL_61_13]
MDQNSDAYYRNLDEMSLMPGWARRQQTLWPEPRPKFKAMIWYYQKARAALEAAGQFISTEQAERRNLVMLNPMEGNNYATSRNIVAAYQMIMPGERARTHRHSASALRLILDVAPGTYTVVNGARIDMANECVVLTPGWCWHGHASDASTPGYWIDFLDVPLIHHLESVFIERSARGYEPPTHTDTRSAYLFSPQEVLGSGSGPVDVVIGAEHMRTIGLHLVRLPSGTQRTMPKSTANNLYAVIKGSARVEVEGGVAGVLGKGDLVAVPCWHTHSLHAESALTLLRVTDEPILQALGYLRSADAAS